MSKIIGLSYKEYLKYSPSNDKYAIEFIGYEDNYSEEILTKFQEKSVFFRQTLVIQADDRVTKLGYAPLDDILYFFSDEQAKEVIALLKKAKAENRDVVVHCNEGSSRTGAVMYVARSLGFDTNKGIYLPNRRIVEKLTKTLEQSYA